jgi:carbamoyl-phosphate synthase large subunit
MSATREVAILVTGAGGPLGVNVTRSLRREGLPRRLRLVGTDANRWHLPLSLCDVTYRIPLAREREGYADALREIAARESVRAVVPTHPVEVRAVAELAREGRLGGLGTALPRPEVLAVADDKAATQQRLQSAGVPVPRTRLLHTSADIEAAYAEYAAPGGVDTVWVRGSGAPGLGIGAAALPCRDPEVARSWVEHHRGWGKMAASEYLPGANLSWIGAFSRGKLLAAGARERLEYVLPHVAPSGVTGAPAVGRTIRHQTVAEIGEKAVRALDSAAHGVYFVDLKGDATGMPRVTEINAGRCGTTVEHYSEAGFNFPHLLARLALGEEVEALPEPNEAVEPDVYWVRTLDCGPVALRGAAAFDACPRAPARDRDD